MEEGGREAVYEKDRDHIVWALVFFWRRFLEGITDLELKDPGLEE
jgi:hypothetical protein